MNQENLQSMNINVELIDYIFYNHNYSHLFSKTKDVSYQVLW